MKHLFIILLSALSIFAQSLPTDNTERAKLARQLTRSIPMELGKIEGNMPQINVLIKKGEKVQAKAMVDEALQKIANIEEDLQKLAQLDENADGDTLLLRFQSPVDGALCLYLVDAEKAPTAYCLLPSETEKKGYQPVAADEKYTFLDFKDQSVIVNTSREQEFNTLYLLFSPNSFAKALDRKGGKNKDGDLLPRNLSYSDFQAWLIKAQTADEQMVVIREVVEIRKAK